MKEKIEMQKVNELISTGAATAEWDRYLGRNVQQIFEDSARNIWFAGENPGWDLAKFDGENWFLTDENGVFAYVREYTSEQQGLYHCDIREPMTFFQDSSGSKHVDWNVRWRTKI